MRSVEDAEVEVHDMIDTHSEYHTYISVIESYNIG